MRAAPRLSRISNADPFQRYGDEISRTAGKYRRKDADTYETCCTTQAKEQGSCVETGRGSYV